MELVELLDLSKLENDPPHPFVSEHSPCTLDWCLLLVWIAALAWLSTWTAVTVLTHPSMDLPQPPLTADTAQFSEERARQHLNTLAGSYWPRPAGSTNNIKVREYITSQLEQMINDPGIDERLELEIDPGPRALWNLKSGSLGVFEPSNVVARYSIIQLR